MARLKKSEALSIRIRPDLKEKLAILSNYWDISIADVVESAISKQMDIGVVALKDVGSEHWRVRLAREGASSMSIDLVYRFVRSSVPIVRQMRLFYLMPKGLDLIERGVCAAVADNPDLFEGDDPLFDALDPKIGELPAFDFEKIIAHLPALRSYSEFLHHNSRRGDGEVIIDYPTYLDLWAKRERSPSSD